MGSLFLIIMAFLSSTLTAVVGLGGGMLLLAVMPVVLPAAAVVPVHGVVQLCSNASRSLFGSRELVLRLLPAFFCGVLIGVSFGSQAVLAVPPEYLPIPLGCFILLMTWLPNLKERLRLPGKFLSLGFAQGFLTLFVGATGPLNLPILLRHGLTAGQVVATHALLMTIVHLLKVITFGLLGFTFVAHLPLMLGMIFAVTAGSWFGTKARNRVSETLLKKILQGLITLFALRMILTAVF